ncbi:MAG: hypothetical protein WAS23_12485 [Dokdonella sp.]|uniref:hypothetical protein n=1 Tax=Dokdonella sp. TaxID=2291710 RepID=UPI002BA2D8BE|nr:hypothetical protein [Dokdonella sp.]HOX70524.1 hypothetical protein [Dokdonella sp.]HPG94631.1 hypothetical protein [Dokdonella sp.]HPN78261.1 hypothetical protein [Dokdonella sp.]
MGEAALDFGIDAARGHDPWPLRLAQRAFAAVLDQAQHHGGFGVGGLRATARAALSALSADDRGLFEDWLSVQLATRPATMPSNQLGILATIDTPLAGAVRQRIPRARARIVDRPPVMEVAA